MQCPACKTVDLVVLEREGVEIDYCPQCRGVWLERNELDTIIRRAAAISASPRIEEPPRQAPEPYRDRDYDRKYDEKQYYKKRKGGFLEDLFDF
jgi:uncharacterized protein